MKPMKAIADVDQSKPMQQCHWRPRIPRAACQFPKKCGKVRTLSFGEKQVSAKRSAPPRLPSLVDDAQLSVKINVAARLTNQAARIRLGDLGAWPGQIPILLWLLDEDGIIQKELVELANMEQSTVAEHLDRMERSGLIFRERDSEDRRSYRIFLTDYARSISAGVLDELESGARLFMHGISKNDMTTFQAVMSKIIANLHRFIQKSAVKDDLASAPELPAAASLSQRIGGSPRKRQSLPKASRTSR